MMIEPEMAALAAANRTTVEMLRLQQAYEAMEEGCSDARLAIQADLDFHSRLFEAGHNQLVTSLLPAFVVLLRANFQVAVQGLNALTQTRTSIVPAHEKKRRASDRPIPRRADDADSRHGVD